MKANTHQNATCTQRFKCGPYVFRSWLPTIGQSSDKPWWTAAINDEEVPGRFGSLEDVMRAALAKAGV